MKNLKKIIRIYCVFIIFLFTLISFTSSSYPFQGFYSWGMSKDIIIKKYLTSGKKYTEFTPIDKPEYKNRIMNYIIAIDKKLKNKIKILRIKSYPERDFLLVNNKLYSVKELYGEISNKKLNKIVKILTSTYGKSNVQKDKNMAIYTFSKEKTKVILLTYFKSNKVDCNIYFYASKLFKMLISES